MENPLSAQARERRGFSRDRIGRFAEHAHGRPGPHANLSPAPPRGEHTDGPPETCEPFEAEALRQAIFDRLAPDLDGAQRRAVWDRLYADAYSSAPSEKVLGQWTDLCAEHAPVGDNPALIPLGDRPPADNRTLRSLTRLPVAIERAHRALEAQVRSVAALAAVPESLARARVEEFRSDYLATYVDMPLPWRPDPPAQWVRGFTSTDFRAKDAPCDPATLHAFYRVQADPNAFGADERNPGRTFASVDLETASAPEKRWFDPANGSIIEVAVIVYDESGAERSRHEVLVRPNDEALAAYGTGNVAVHGITVTDVADQPDWASRAPGVAQALAGHTMLAQNAEFETQWLDHHLARAGHPWTAPSTVDTLRIAQQHFADLDNHRLATICEAVGVRYTNGHRAAHDAEVAAEAFFAMRRAIHARWAADPRLASLPEPRRD